jgi:hypothetical protein
MNRGAMPASQRLSSIISATESHNATTSAIAQSSR